MRPNVLFITLDQFRADHLSCAGHPVVRTPHLDDLATNGVRFANHHGQAAPCGPGRASLYTGMYQMNHRVVGNGTPLDRRFDNIALAARRAGYAPALFGYTDQAIDPRDADGPDDPRLRTYNGILPGFDGVLVIPDELTPWADWLTDLGYDTPTDPTQLLKSEPDRPEAHSVGAFLTDRALAWIGLQTRPWFVHLSYLRPHPPYAAPGHWSTAYDPDELPLPIAASDDASARTPFHDAALADPRSAAPSDPAAVALMRAQYAGMVGHVDHQLGRLWDALRASGSWDDTFVVIAADHGEMLGDHGLKDKLGYWEQSFATPCIVRDPRSAGAHGTVIVHPTENIDVMPTLCEAMAVAVPAQCDGLPLTPFLHGEPPPYWRTATHWEYDWRDQLVGRVGDDWPWDRTLERQHLAVIRTATHAYVQFGNGSSICFDLAADPTWRTPTEDAAVMLGLAQQMLTWRSRHTDRTLADLVLRANGPVGRGPDDVAG